MKPHFVRLMREPRGEVVACMPLSDGSGSELGVAVFKMDRSELAAAIERAGFRPLGFKLDGTQVEPQYAVDAFEIGELAEQPPSDLSQFRDAFDPKNGPVFVKNPECNAGNEGAR